MIEIKGKDGGNLYFEMNEAGKVNKIFYSKDKDLFFMYEISNEKAINLSYFKSQFELLLNDSSASCGDEVLNFKEDTWFIKQLKNIFPFYFTKPARVIKSECLGIGFDLTDFSYLSCGKRHYSSDYSFSFLIYDPYYTLINDINEDNFISMTVMIH